MGTPTSFRSAIGDRLRAIRLGQGLSQDELARNLRWLGGSHWSRSTVAKLEGGTRELSLEEALLMCAALSIQLSDLAPRTGLVQIGDSSISGHAVKAFFEGRQADDELLRGLVRPRGRQTVRRAGEEVKTFYAPRRSECERVYGSEVPGAVVLGAVAASKGEAERKAAAKLHIDPVVLGVCAQKLWGTSLTEERDRRISTQGESDAGARTLQAVRGHTTRELLSELRDYLADLGGKS